jgi:hypothetical protein
MSRYSKHCASCGKHFIIPGTCADYLYKRGKLYYCGYNCWNHAEYLRLFPNTTIQQEPSQPDLRHISDEPKRS